MGKINYPIVDNLPFENKNGSDNCELLNFVNREFVTLQYEVYILLYYIRIPFALKSITFTLLMFQPPTSAFSSQSFLSLKRVIQE